MPSKRPVSFADKVRVRATPETDARRVAGLVGVVYGETRPSVTSVTVIGAVTSDYAVNVHFEGQTETLWFAPELLEFADHAPEGEPDLVAAPKEMKLWFKR
jgi:hypothetical protein